MRVSIFTEGGKHIGLGHITRCLSIYEAFMRQGVPVKLMVNADASVAEILVNTQHRIGNWLERTDILEEELSGSQIAIIDSYMADISVYRGISKLVKVAAYVDDEDRLDYPKGVVLAWNRDRDKDQDSKSFKRLTGGEYAPLRNEFYLDENKKIREEIKNILVTFGGSDPKNMSVKVLKILNEKYPIMIKKVVVTEAFRCRKELECLKDDLTEIVYSPGPAKMKSLMMDSDLAISAGGQTLFELARTGTPSVILCVTDNQLTNIDMFKRAGFIEKVITCDNEELLADTLENIESYFSYETRSKQSLRGKEIVDGKGGDRIVEFLLNEAR